MEPISDAVVNIVNADVVAKGRGLRITEEKARCVVAALLLR